MKIIKTRHDIEIGLDRLVLIEPQFHQVRKEAGEIPLRREAPTLSNFIRIVVGQQVSVSSARAIWERCQINLDVNNAEALLSASEETLRASGLSRPKMKTIRAIATAVAEQGLDFKALADNDPIILRKNLTQIHGVGTLDIRHIRTCLPRTSGCFSAWRYCPPGGRQARVRPPRAAKRG